jgi:glycerol dehydrogenase
MPERLPLVFAAPGTYVQGPGILATAGPHLARFGARMFAVLDPNIFDVVELGLAGACQSEGLGCRAERFPGECTEKDWERLAEIARTWKPDAIIAAGGGKALDTGKLVADALRLPAVMVPTIASTDAPTSRVAVVYDNQHAVVRVARLRANPALVLVDTALVIKAPVRFLVAGMGDALSTWPEARSNAEGAARTPVGGSQTRAAMALAELSYRIVLQQGREARRDAESQTLSAAFEAVVEANTLLSGLGFESGGLAVCHALHAGLSAIPACRGAMHGEKVAFGVIVQSLVEGWPEVERVELVEFYRDVGLPATLAGLGMATASPEDLARIVEITCRPGSHIHNLRRPVRPTELIQVLEALRS